MNDLLTALVRTGRFTPTEAYQRFAYACAALLLVSALFHGGVYLVDGGPWEGPVSWRKPIVFGLSFTVTVATLAWFLTFLHPRKATGWTVVMLLVVTSFGEVFLIAMQKWRGVASHFNDSTAFDTLVFSAMGMLVAVIALVTVFITVRSFLRIDAPASLALAIRTGLVLMLVSQAVGGQMIAEGGNTIGAAGALKVPHAVTLHAVQVLPALALLLLVADFPERHRVRTVGLAAVGYAFLIASTMLQTYSGRGPLDPGVGSTVLAIVGLAILAGAAVIALRGIILAWRRSPLSPGHSSAAAPSRSRPGV